MVPNRAGASDDVPVDALASALRPWLYQLAREAVGRWLIRGAIGAGGVACLVLGSGWVAAWPEATLRPWAVQLGALVLLAAVVFALRPISAAHRTGELDARLGCGDRLATAWAFRDSQASLVGLQRSDAIAHLAHRSPQADLAWRPSRTELGGLAGVGILLASLATVPSPQQAILDKQAADQASVDNASQRLDTLRQEAALDPSLTPEQARQLNELLQQAQAELRRAGTQQQASTVLTHTQDQVGQQLADPSTAQRDDALAGMSEALGAEPLTQPLGEALQREDATAASAALQTLAARADRLSDVERQALSRALQRAANVGRADPSSSAALRDAATALGSGQSPAAALTAADAAFKDALRADSAQAMLRQTIQQLADVQAQLASGQPINPGDPARLAQDAQRAEQPYAGTPSVSGTPQALDSAPGGLARDPSSGPIPGGIETADQVGPAQSLAVGDAPENVFVPGREGPGPADQDLVNQPFTLRGAPRPYRDVLSQYAQSGRDYVDRPDVSPAVRDLVKQYFQTLEDGQ